MIELHPESRIPLYEQLYLSLAGEIRSGILAPGRPLPGRRTMAEQLGVSVNTVDTAYQMLAAEGLAESRPRRGFFVQETGGMLRGEAPAPAPRHPAALPDPLPSGPPVPGTTCPPWAWTRHFFPPAAGAASSGTCCTTVRLSFSAGRPRATPSCAPQLPSIWPLTGGSAALPSRWW